MRVFLSLILAFFLWCPVFGETQTPFLAIYSSRDLVECWQNSVHKPDLLFKTKNFSELDTFLTQVKQQASGRKIILDICVHGDSRSGFLCIKANKKEWSFASMGFLLNHIESFLGTENFDLILDSCYAGSVYKRSLHYLPITQIGTFLRIEDYKGERPKYPVWGVANHMSLVGLALEEYIHSHHRFTQDIRDNTKTPVSKAIDQYLMNKEKENLVLFYFLDHRI